MRGKSSRHHRRWGWMVIGLLGCAGQADQGDTPPADPGKDSPAPVEAPVVLFVGTSLTAGYGLDPDQAWTTLVQQRIDEAELPFRVVNAGVSGETSAGALRRLEWVLGQDPPALVMVETGANDGLRGQDVDSMAANLEAILSRLDRVVPRPAVIVAGRTLRGGLDLRADVVVVGTGAGGAMMLRELAARTAVAARTISGVTAHQSSQTVQASEGMKAVASMVAGTASATSQTRAVAEGLRAHAEQLERLTGTFRLPDKSPRNG